MEIPDALRMHVLGAFGEAAEGWLERLPETLARYAARWSLTVGPPYPDLSFNYVAPAVLPDGSDAVLKLGVPNEERSCEVEALRLYDGEGVARLLACDPEGGALLMERLRPGTTLVSVDDETATSVAASLMRRMWRPAPEGHSFPTVARWAEGLSRLRERYHGGTGPFPADIVDRAERLFAELFASSSEQVLLHGDLHHMNILAAGREPWLAIDPKGVVGERGYEVMPFLNNPEGFTSRPDAARHQARRLDQFAEELGLDRERLRAWAVAGAVLSAWWSIEDHSSGWKTTIHSAQTLASFTTG